VAQEKTIDLSGEKATEEERPKDKKPHHANVKERPSDASGIYTRVDRAERAWEKDIRVRCERTQQRIVEWLEGREDEELATIIREDGAAMIGGMIAMCGGAEWLRKPVVGAMAVFEPLIAFGRLIRVLAGRWRLSRIEAAEQRAQAEWEAAAEAQRAAEEEAAQPQGFRHNVVE
jgi:hypothetical protein